ncbi:kell blood group glycoprotein isoform X1 [Cyanistes caeruleus]|uniref:kell blood group glycoprotein isoform X1 n=1 Tax=Cyanistes caeruleus TaxID=156563 RepID=UPI000CDB2629|nr:kell blood group glycoprotein isoform X1 [Cyanistes caeruleus]XP_023795245.1 kell blood group glycoprotein isoform X1 [Cyanistes caeruleus]XP_023795250.1 kell blood group glycoprotein isoform X1 [Cyanistes caeruleus]XP_023795255.1 kell blood group glycoprotein isoform X1 [Cyanistes caeruleus]
MSTLPQTCDQELRTGAEKERCLQRKSLLLCALLLSTLLGFTLLITYLMMTCALGSCDAESDLALLERLLNSRNDTLNPCENFYKYACGRWEGKQSSRTREESLNVFDVLLEENLLILKRLLESSQSGVRGSAKEKAMQFYRSCMDTERIESQGAQPLKDFLNQVGGWHETGVGETKDFNETLQILMSRYSTFPFFRVHVGPSPFDPKTNIIQIDHPEFDIPLESEFKGKNYLEVLRVYLSYLKKLGVLLGKTEDGSPDSFSLTLSFISNLQKFVTPLQKRQQRGMLFFRTTIRELQEKAPAIDWLACLKAVFQSVPMNLSQPIAVHDMDYLSNMSQLIEKWHKGRVPHIYMIVCLVGNLSPALDSQFQDARLELYKILYGKMGSRMIPAERWRKCLSDTSSFFDPVLGKMIVQEIFPEQTKKFAEQMFSVIQDALCDRLDQVEWMDEQTRQNAKASVSKLQVEIGYPAHILQTDKVNLEYQNLEINEDTFFLNVVACLKVLRENSYLKLLQHYPQKNWHVHPWSVHSYYSMTDHMVVLPAGMFRSPFFHTEFPSAVNFGAIGVFMAHEILHSFYGYVLPGGCPACNRSALQRSIDCLVEQYESYSFNVNGTFTLLENTADTGGVAIAYQAYKNWLKKHKEKDLPKIGLSHDQLFYLSFAHAMCGYQDPEMLQSSLNTDPHSPLPLRVSGPVSNSQDFSKSFQCPSGSPMNPDNKCRIW